MSKMTLQQLKEIGSQQRPAGANTIRVNLDTGGIAAGAEKVFKLLDKKVPDTGKKIDVLRTGSLGLAYADPVVEVRTEGMPGVLYGNVTLDAAERIITEHLGKGLLLDDCFISRAHVTGEHYAPIGGDDVRYIIVVDTDAEDAGAVEPFKQAIVEELKKAELFDQVQVVRGLDLGIYNQGLCAQVLPGGQVYSGLSDSDAANLVELCVKRKQIYEAKVAKDTVYQTRIVLRNCGIIDPESMDDYLAHSGYQAIRQCLETSPEDVIEQMKTAGLRGRGGAGFPTWLKWKLARDVESEPKYVICNADEGDPGAFMDRSVLEGDPHAVLEGMMVAAYATGAQMGYFYIRAEYPMAIKRVQIAIEQARAQGLLGENILGTGFSFDAKIRLGAGAFVCGEETALIASIEGKRGSPVPRPPFPAQSGLFGKSTTINNVETLASVPAILCMGAEKYGALGTDKSNGTKVFAVTGKVTHAQLVEVAMGTTIRQIVYGLCGGISDGKKIKGVQTGGPSGGVIPEAHLDTPISYENLAQLGSIMGSGGMLAMDEGDCMVDVAKFYLKFCVDESCGKCAPCRVGGYQMLQYLEKITSGKGEASDLSQMRSICNGMQKASLCGLGQTAPNPVLSTLRFFESEYAAYIEGGRKYAREMAKKIGS